jgi:hypothetical protein
MCATLRRIAIRPLPRDNVPRDGRPARRRVFRSGGGTAHALDNARDMRIMPLVHCSMPRLT